MNAQSPFRPRDTDETADFLRACSQEGTAASVRGGGSKAAFGRPPGEAWSVIDVTSLSGIMLYEPDELVLTARAGTTLSEIEAAVAERKQCLAFEPPVLGRLFGCGGAPTLGGAIASGWSGPRRIRAGAVRDHVLGALAVGGDGQLFKSGGRVVKNVTGFDLPKLLTGSHGTLAILTEITIKILPAAESSHTLVALGLDDLAAIQLLSRLLAGPFEISGAAHLPASVAARAGLDAVAGTSATLVRLEGFGPSVTERRFALEARIGAQHGIHTPDEQAADRLWRVVRDVAALLPDGHVVWRLSLPATDSVAAVTAISRHIPDDAGPVEAYYDWGGSLVWLALPPADDAHASLVRASLPSGHATLMRASPAARAQVPVFQPQQAALAALAGRVKAAFDPHGVLAPRFMGEGA